MSSSNACIINSKWSALFFSQLLTDTEFVEEGGGVITIAKYHFIPKSPNGRVPYLSIISLYANVPDWTDAVFTSTRAKLVEVLVARRWNLQSWRHKAICFEPSTAELGTHNVWTATLARTSIACSRLQCKLYACKSLCIFVSLNGINLCWLGLTLQKYALFNVF